MREGRARGAAVLSDGISAALTPVTFVPYVLRHECPQRATHLPAINRFASALVARVERCVEWQTDRFGQTLIRPEAEPPAPANRHMSGGRPRPRPSRPPNDIIRRCLNRRAKVQRGSAWPHFGPLHPLDLTKPGECPSGPIAHCAGTSITGKTRPKSIPHRAHIIDRARGETKGRAAGGIISASATPRQRFALANAQGVRNYASDTPSSRRAPVQPLGPPRAPSCRLHSLVSA